MHAIEAVGVVAERRPGRARGIGRRAFRASSRLAIVPLLLALVAMAVAPRSAAATPDPLPVPVIGALFADRGVEPTAFSPDDIGRLTNGGHSEAVGSGVDNYVRSITWSSWGGSEAVGHGQVSLVDGDEFTYESPPAHTSGATVTLSDIEVCDGVRVYASYALELDPQSTRPTRWPLGSRGTIPCSGVLGGFYRPTGSARSQACISGLYQPRPNPGAPGVPLDLPARWVPPLPGGGTTALCDLKFSRPNSANPRASGLYENLNADHRKERNWPAVVEYAKPIWCPGATEGKTPISFSELRVVIFGAGRTPTKKSLSSYGHRGLAVTARSRQQFQASQLCHIGFSLENPIP